MAAAYPRRHQNPLPFLEGCHFGAELGDLADNFGTDDVGHRDLNPRQSLPDPKVQVIQAAGLDFDEGLVFLDLGGGNLGVFKDIWTAMMVKHDCFHLDPPF